DPCRSQLERTELVVERAATAGEVAQRPRLSRLGRVQLAPAGVEFRDRGLELVYRDLPVRVRLADERGTATELEGVAAHHVAAHHAGQGLRVTFVERHRPVAGDAAHLRHAVLELGEGLGQGRDLDV